MGKNMRSPSKEPHADGRSTYTYNRVRPGSPKGYDRCNWAGCRGGETMPPTIYFVSQNRFLLLVEDG
jgi:hypothetical protein